MSTLTMNLNIERIHSIVSDYCTQDDLKHIDTNIVEQTVDIRVFNLMETMYPENEVISQTIKNEPVYNLIKSKQKTGMNVNEGVKSIILCKILYNVLPVSH